MYWITEIVKEVQKFTVFIIYQFTKSPNKPPTIMTLEAKS